MRNWLAGLFLTGAATMSVAGGAVDVSLDLESARIEHEAKLVESAALFNVGGILTENSFWGEEKHYLLLIGAHAVDPNASHELNAGVGGKLYGFQMQGSDFGVALGLGGFVRYQPDIFFGAGVELGAYYAPDVLAWANSTQMGELTARLSYKLLPQARVFVGYNYIAAEQDNKPREIQNSANIGFRVNY